MLFVGDRIRRSVSSVSDILCFRRTDAPPNSSHKKSRAHSILSLSKLEIPKTSEIQEISILKQFKNKFAFLILTSQMSQEDYHGVRSKEIESLHAISEILHCQLDRRTLKVLLELIEAGIHPEALADIVLESRAALTHST